MSPMEIVKRIYVILLIFTLGEISTAAPPTIEDRIKNYGPTIKTRVLPYFDKAEINYPPEKLLYVVLKKERRLKVFAPNNDGDWKFVVQYPLAVLSGKSGPKLKEGDKQIPEGIYKASHLNPMSKFWLSIGINYPNEFDRQQAKSDNRKKLGGDIMIHGYWFSTGCIAVGNAAIEDLFVMAALTKPLNVKIIIAPQDFRISAVSTTGNTWVKDLYSNIEKELTKIGDQGISSSDSLVYYPDAYNPEEILQEFLNEIFDWIVIITKSNAKSITDWFVWK